MSRTRADKIYYEAYKKATSFKIPFFMDEEDIYHNSAELFEKAGHLYKNEKINNKAIDSYTNAGRCYLHANQDYDSIRVYEMAANLCKNIDENKMIILYDKIIYLMIDQGMFNKVGETYIKIAEFYNKNGDVINTIKNYQNAIEFFEQEGIECGKYIIKVGDLFALSQHYTKAILTYDKVAHQYINNNILKYQVRKIIYKILLCYFANRIDIFTILHKYCNLDISFTNSREYNLILSIKQSIENNDIEIFQKSIKEYDDITRFDDWNITILSRIKKRIEEFEIDLA